MRYKDKIEVYFFTNALVVEKDNKITFIVIIFVLKGGSFL